MNKKIYEHYSTWKYNNHYTG